MFPPAGRFVEVLVTAPPETLRARDPKGLYARADSGRISQFSGTSAPYEAPVAAELTLNTNEMEPSAAADRVIDLIVSLGLFDA